MTRLLARCRARFPDFSLDAELDLPVEGVTALFGPSGSGKSTFLRLIAGLDRVAGNRITVEEEIWQDDARGIFIAPHRRAIGFVFQETHLFPHLSVAANIAYGLKRSGRRRQEFSLDQVVGILDLGGLLARAPGTLSGGERQRVAIARAVLTSPRLLLMDEPLASLDADRKAEILPFIERLGHDLGVPILYVSHAIEEVLRLASTLALIDKGRIIATGPIEEVTSRLDLHPYTGRLDAGAVLRATVRAHDPARGITRLAFKGGELIVPEIDAPPGSAINVRIRSRDVALSLEAPLRTSILNILPGKVVQIADGDGPQAHVLLDIGSPLWARITKLSVRELALASGVPIYALIKAVAVDRRSLGRPTAMDTALDRT
ncbi:MAG: Maltose/maltodextrin import ATP-binding protein MalK [Alphaproteobacteria bacterium MarineAlpha10_Bin3]|jgi:molybdate transport system ATP-binding protein|nr:MAG: Maltose/maltodextrin import ATP-binding protein MalK [Alphaproteobacteria bacterium MarineAlpha10_Bin3]PPR71257.1 MAG: Maltose/maltodextrin import ATP-binding protein MalK [Alphaproteobacteria bacterium MarineAlpha4_Bin1]